KIGISACFFHADPQRAIFKGMTLQYIEQNMAHWVMQQDAMALMLPSPDGETRREGSRIGAADYARELDALVLMGGSDVCPESYGERALRPNGTVTESATTTKLRYCAHSWTRRSRCLAYAAARRSSMSHSEA